MKALLLKETNAAIQLADVPKPTPAPHEVLIRLKAAALNHRDLWISRGLYPKMQLPCVLGSDGAGVVEAVGDRVRNTQEGKEVIINPGMNWGNNHDVASKDFEILGMPHNGTFAEYVCVPSVYVHPKPHHLSFEEAAALPLAGVTAYRALFTRSAARIGEKVLITGIGGGVALQTLQFALSHSQKVYVTSGSEEKLNMAREMGAHGGVSYLEKGWQKTLKKEAGLFDVIIDSAGGEEFGKLVELAAPAGRITFYGGTTGNISGIVPGFVFFKQLTIMGTTMGSEQDFENMVLLVNAHQIVPKVDSIFKIEEAAQAFEHMANSKQFGKIVLKI